MPAALRSVLPPRYPKSFGLVNSLAGNLLTGPNFTSGWTPNNSILKAAAALAPDSSFSAASLIEDNTSNNHYVSQNATVVASTSYKFSYLAKRIPYAGLRNIETFIFQGGFSSGMNAIFDLGTGAVNNNPGGFGTGFTSVTSKATFVGDGWWLCELDFTTAVGVTTLIVNSPSMVLANVDATYLGDGKSGVLIWNAWLR